MIPTPFRKSAPPGGPIAPPSASEAPEPAMAEAAEHQSIPPEAVAYHDGSENCGACEYLGEQDQCSRLQMPVDPAGHCTLFTAGGGGSDAAVAPELADQPEA